MSLFSHRRLCHHSLYPGQHRSQLSSGRVEAGNRIVTRSYRKKATSGEAQHRNVRCVLCLCDEETLAYGLFTKAFSDALIFTLTLSPICLCLPLSCVLSVTFLLKLEELV